MIKNVDTKKNNNENSIKVFWLDSVKVTKKKVYDKLNITVWIDERNKNDIKPYVLWLKFFPVKKNKDWKIVTVVKKNPVTWKEEEYPTFDYNNTRTKKLIIDDIIKIKKILLKSLWYVNYKNEDELKFQNYWTKWWINIAYFMWSLYIKYIEKDTKEEFTWFINDVEQERLLLIINELLNREVKNLYFSHIDIKINNNFKN